MGHTVRMRVSDVPVALGHHSWVHPSSLIPWLLSELQLPEPPGPPPPPGTPGTLPSKDEVLAAHPAFAATWQWHEQRSHALAHAGRAQPVEDAWRQLKLSVQACEALSDGERARLLKDGKNMYFSGFGEANETGSLRLLQECLPDRFGQLVWHAAENTPMPDGLQVSVELHFPLHDLTVVLTGRVDGLVHSAAPSSAQQRPPPHAVIEVKNRMYAVLADKERQRDDTQVLAYMKTHGAEVGVLAEHSRRPIIGRQRGRWGKGRGKLLVEIPRGSVGAVGEASASGDGGESLLKLPTAHRVASGRLRITTFTREAGERWWEEVAMPGLAAFLWAVTTAAAGRKATAAGQAPGVDDFDTSPNKVAWYNRLMRSRPQPCPA